MKKEVKSPTSESREKVLTIYSYTDYRAYLRDYYAFRKQTVRGYSFRMFAKNAEFQTPNILQLVMEGKRNLTAESTEKFIKGLHLAGHMAEYFRHLVKMNQATNDEEKIEHYNELQRLTPLAKRRLLSADAVEYLSHWLFPVMREMIQLGTFRDDPYWIAQRLTDKATVEQITAALAFLENAGFISRNAEGVWTPKDDLVISSEEIRALAIRQYHRMMIEQAKERLNDLAPEDREFGALTFGLPEESFAELKFKIKEFRSSLHLWAMQAAQGRTCDTVIQVNMIMYPQTKRSPKK